MIVDPIGEHRAVARSLGLTVDPDERAMRRHHREQRDEMTRRHRAERLALEDRFRRERLGELLTPAAKLAEAEAADAGAGAAAPSFAFQTPHDPCGNPAGRCAHRIACLARDACAYGDVA